jgi:hypothetical protein
LLVLALRPYIPLDIFNDFEGNFLDQGHRLAMRMLTEEGARPNHKVDTIDTTLHGLLSIFHVASYMCQDFGLESKLADLLAILERLRGRDCILLARERSRARGGTNQG